MYNTRDTREILARCIAELFAPPKWAQRSAAVFNRWHADNKRVLAQMDRELPALRIGTNPTPEQGVNPFIAEVS